MQGEDRVERTRDSRFLRHKLSGGEFELYSMYIRNIRVEGDGLAYHELNLLRTIVLQPIFYVLIGNTIMLRAYIDRPNLPRGGSVGYVLALTFAHVVGFIFNILRYLTSVAIFLTECFVWPIRICLGIIMAPIGMLLCAGHIYALPCSMMHTFVRGAGAVVFRKVKVEPLHLSPRTFNAGGIGQVNCYEAQSAADASYLASTLKIKQRCGVGPECIWIRGRRLFVSNWTPINLTWLFAKAKYEWKLLDLTTMEWRITRFEFDHGKTNDTARSSEDHHKEAGTWAFVQSFADLGVITTLAELESYYYSPLGWNKYHRMSAEGHRLRVVRNDRRALSHLLAMVSSLLLYLQFGDSSQGWLGLSVELYGLVIANYALITSYAAEILLGKSSDVVEAKSDRYGAIVTRAIDRGYVRGFHVPNGDWLRYGNGERSLPLHDIKRCEVNVTCNSYVYECEHGSRIKVISYNGYPPEFSLPWDPSEAV